MRIPVKALVRCRRPLCPTAVPFSGLRSFVTAVPSVASPIHSDCSYQRALWFSSPSALLSRPYTPPLLSRISYYASRTASATKSFEKV
ncbi:hypothetical protein J009_06758 [Cryptococcus neoformans]|nr:hypothetical protein C344_06651 [Cryptococcus neoformans var. grubii AD1-7a]OXH21683.1 hypothetical protein J009_06758 [Cryptococcus neoformans var. grubii]OXH43807.1 hypothetical protein J002_06764 [Cryptococcus neoformans var. grubii]OXH61936.1 hypothetical protein J001_06757 [Cryptococcus neoformans var. grubii]